MIDLIAAATVGAIAGYGICAVMTVGKVADIRSDALLVDHFDAEHARSAHSRAADALATKQARIDRALACETPKAAHGVKKMARILRGDA